MRSNTTTDAGSISEPTSDSARPAASAAATGANTSRPWNVADAPARANGERPMSTASAAPPDAATAGSNSPLSGPTNRAPERLSTAIARRAVPTPGSTTAR